MTPQEFLSSKDTGSEYSLSYSEYDYFCRLILELPDESQGDWDEAVLYFIYNGKNITLRSE